MKFWVGIAFVFIALVAINIWFDDLRDRRAAACAERHGVLLKAADGRDLCLVVKFAPDPS